MKKWLILAGCTLAVGSLVSSYFYVRANGIRLSGVAFIKKAGSKDSCGSMHSISFAGIRNGKAYLDTWDMNRIPRTIIYWTNVHDLPEGVREEMEHESGRWRIDGPERVAH